MNLVLLQRYNHYASRNLKLVVPKNVGSLLQGLTHNNMAENKMNILV